MSGHKNINASIASFADQFVKSSGGRKTKSRKGSRKSRRKSRKGTRKSRKTLNKKGNK